MSCLFYLIHELKQSFILFFLRFMLLFHKLSSMLTSVTVQAVHVHLIFKEFVIKSFARFDATLFILLFLSFLPINNRALEILNFHGFIEICLLLWRLAELILIQLFLSISYELI